MLPLGHRCNFSRLRRLPLRIHLCCVFMRVFLSVFLFSEVLICGAQISLAQTETTPGSTHPGQAIPGTGGVSPFAGSVPGKLVAGVVPLSLQDAIDRGLKQNLGLLLSLADIGAARGQRWEQLSALLPHVP